MGGPDSRTRPACGLCAAAGGRLRHPLNEYARAPWPSRCPSSGAIGTDCTTRAARSGSACASPAPSCPRAPTRSAPRSPRPARASSTRRPHDDEALLAVHDPALLAYLAGAWGEWEAAGLTRDPGQDRVVPYVFAHAGLTDTPAIPVAPSARAGYFAYDTMTLIGPGTWEAARAAVDVALTAADLVLAGAPAAYACCRPPGHHVTRGELRRLVLPEQHGRRGRTPARRAGRSGRRARRRRPPRQRHAGDLLRRTPTCSSGSVHVDPGAGWFPHFLGFAERDGRRRATATCRWRPGPATRTGSRRSRALAQWARGAARSGRRAGRRRRRRRPGEPAARSPPPASAPPAARSARCGLPTVVVQEGGYDLDAIGALVHEFLTGLEEGADG